MEQQPLERFLLSFVESDKTFPFGEDVAVFKVCGKMFALLAWQDTPLRLTLKSEPEEALILRGQFTAISPGYHMNKDHWNTVSLDGSITDDLLKEMIEASYWLVVGRLKKLDRDRLMKP